VRIPPPQEGLSALQEAHGEFLPGQRLKGAVSRSISICAPMTASSGTDISSIGSTNSSPPSRASVSTSRSRLRRRFAITAGNSSPAG